LEKGSQSTWQIKKLKKKLGFIAFSTIHLDTFTKSKQKKKDNTDFHFLQFFFVFFFLLLSCFFLEKKSG